VPVEKNDKISELKLRARLPKIFGGLAIVLLAASICAIVVSLVVSRSDPEFRMKGFPTSLSKDVVATIDGYERREMDGELTKYYVRADRAVSFADNHQELENVFLEVFSDDGATSDKISAEKAVYVPAENKNFTAYFAGAVNVDTRDKLHVKTEQLTYTKETELASAEELVEFDRANVRGKSFGATVKVREKLLELLKDVEIHADGRSEAERSTLTAGNAVYDQAHEKVDLTHGVSAALSSAGDNGKPARTSELTAGRATALLGEGATAETKSIDNVELFDGVQITSREGGGAPTKITSNYALYQKPIDRFDLRGAVYILTVEGDRPTEVRADNAIYEQPQGLINLTGNSSVTQTTSLVQGNSIHAELNAARKLKLAEVKDNALVKQTTPERTTEVTGPKLRAVFHDDQALAEAHVTGAGKAALIPVNAADYTKLALSAEQAIDVDFKGEGLLDKIVTHGRTNIRMDVPNNSPDAANKSVTADSVTTSFAANGKDISNAVATGNGVLVISPLSVSETNFQTTINAPRFDCDFFPAGNDPKTCVAATKTKTVRVPTQPAADRGTQNMTSEKLIANFNPRSRELDSLEAIGDAKFNELDRNGTSDRIVYTSADQTVRLRGGNPSVWDSKARAKAHEIDWNTRDEVSELRGGASTTYYSQSGTGGAAPFGKSGKPVYITAESARFDHRSEVAVFTGNARGWQDNNYVRGHRLTISQKDGRFVAEENVQSLLYEAKRKENGVETNQPVFVSAQKLTYTRDTRLMRYENNVDIRQGKERITAGVANVYLTENNEPSKTEIEQNVVITQPNRRASADFARYETAVETVYLRGNPATVDDAEQGRTQGSEITVNLKENRFVSQGPSKQNSSGRTRSVYKPKNQ
jgi:lipopolysaccharide transport protein LptA/LPS export ABC transporter protein LptC